jgi:acyl-CoA synthetase (AMP-forming)/AMP-acid ligase II
MYPGRYATLRPDHPAWIMAGRGSRITYAELDLRSNQFAQLLDARGVPRDGTVAIAAENRLEWAEAIWGVVRSGRYVAPINWHLGGAELASILKACAADAVVVTRRVSATLADMRRTLPNLRLVLALDATRSELLPHAWLPYEPSLARQSTDAVLDERFGGRVMFSSGTTGAPKVIRHPGLDMHPADAAPHLGAYTELFSFDADTVYLCPAPIYHTAPFRFVLAIMQLGGTVVCLEQFDAEAALAAIERYRVTHAQFVPTMFVRMLRLDSAVRQRFELSSLAVAITGAAPCPAALKNEIMDWWGPVVHELYGASESYGNCHIGPEEARSHPGSVGRAIRGRIHITDPGGEEVPQGQIGQVWFEGTSPFVYAGQEDATVASTHSAGWSTVGDLGRLDEDGYLYLAGRSDDVIISGGVNIHPAQAEGALAVHPAVSDVGVIGIPDPEYGESVLAVVVPMPSAHPSDALATELIDFCRDRIASFQCPRRVVFAEELPRGDNGKLYKRELRARFGGSGGA